jgi:hypothetical protein
VCYYGWDDAHCPLTKKEHGSVYGRRPCAVVCEGHYTPAFHIGSSVFLSLQRILYDVRQHSAQSHSIWRGYAAIGPDVDLL